MFAIIVIEREEIVMARGNIAKSAVVAKIAEAFGDNYIGEFDKKFYVWAQENGERVQIAISLTCPKTPIEVATNLVEDDSDWDFTDDKPKAAIAVSNAAPAEISEQEIKNLEDLMKKLGL